MNSRAWFAICGFVLLGSSCEQAEDVMVPMFPDGGLLRTGTPLTREQLYMFEGNYHLDAGTKLFGDDVSVRTSKGTVSVLSPKNAGFSVLGTACLPDHRVLLEGYWQYPTLAQAGLVQLFVQPPEVADALCKGEVPAASEALTLSGTYGQDSEFPSDTLSFSWRKELKPWRGKFFTVAHHGACENTDHCGAAPNSLESIRLAERIGSNAAELDVRITRDGQPILFHDPGLSRTLVKGLFCNGQVKSLSLAELRGACQLRYGELIPTLEEALDMMIDDTELEGTYLDMKDADAVLPSVRIIAKKEAELAERNGNDDPSDDRKFGMLLGIPKDDVLQAWRSAKATLADEGLIIPKCLLEYDPDLVLSEGCVAWGPTWTEGPKIEDVARLHAAGAGTIFWTINQSEFIDHFLTEALPDGIITARAALVFSRYQQIGSVPPRSGVDE